MPDTKRTATGVLGGLAGLVGLSAIAGLLVTATVTPAIALTSNAATSAINMFDKLPSYLDIEALMLPTTFYYKTADTGKYAVLTQFYDQNRSPVTYDQVAPVMYDAILSSEDPRFYEHGGVDLIGTTRALLQNAKGGGETQGGSSISQQYVKNILVQRCESNAQATDTLTKDQVLANCWTEAVTASGTEGYQRKLQEMRYAIALEQRYSKNEILLGYLNIANFGGTNYGIDAAARYYFGVPASKLTLAQAATLAGIVQNPNIYRIDLEDGTTTDASGAAVNSAADGYKLTEQRRSYVLGRMLKDGKITKAQYEEADAEPIVPKITAPKTGCANSVAPYFCQYVKSVVANDPAFGATNDDRTKALRQGGLKIYTTLDITLQKSADKTMAKYAPDKVKGFDKKGKFGSTAVSVEADTGRVLSIAQNTKFSESASTAKDPAYSSLVFAGNDEFGNSGGFEAGSTFKLFTLIDWLEKGHSVNEVLNGRNKVYDRFTNSCDGDWVNFGKDKVDNYGGVGGYVGTPMRFTRDSLNSGFFAMAHELDLCDIKNDATKLGVVLASTGKPVAMNSQFSIIGSNNVSPLAMAGAYATVANNGIYCQPKVIDKMTDADGNDMALPERTCEQVLDPKVAATAAYALQGVMRSGGTGSQGNPSDGTPLIGKTGTHETWQTWLIESSTKVTTATWVGNYNGKGTLKNYSYKGIALNSLRYSIARAIQGKANDLYGGKDFPKPDSELTRIVYKDLPDVVGLSISAAKKKLTDAGFDVRVGEAVDSPEGKDIVAKQSPGAGRVAGGSTITIYPSNGQGLTIPEVAGQSLESAMGALRSTGFGNVQPGTCTQDDTLNGNQTRALSTAPGANTVANRNATISVNYAARSCGFGGPGGGGGPGNP